jgi:hypothetical protein
VTGDTRIRFETLTKEISKQLNKGVPRHSFPVKKNFNHHDDDLENSNFTNYQSQVLAQPKSSGQDLYELKRRIEMLVSKH